MRDVEDKLKILNIQLIGSLLYIVSISVTIVLICNQKRYTLHQKPIFDTKKTYLISNLNRLFILGIVIAFFYSSYELRELSKEKNSNIALNDLDLFASTLVVISAIIISYINLNSPIENSLDIENPNI